MSRNEKGPALVSARPFLSARPYFRRRSISSIAPIQKLALIPSASAIPEIAPQFGLRPSSESVSLSNQACTNPVEGDADEVVQRTGTIFGRRTRVLPSGENRTILRLTTHLLLRYEATCLPFFLAGQLVENMSSTSVPEVTNFCTVPKIAIRMTVRARLATLTTPHRRQTPLEKPGKVRVYSYEPGGLR